MPAAYAFQTNIPVRITDLNYGGHVGNDTILSIMHEARIQFLQHHGYTELEFAGAGLIMNDVAIAFKKELFYGDVVIASLAVSDISKVSFDVFYKLEKQSGDKRETVVFAKTGMICYDYKNKRPVKIPDEAIDRLVGGL